jgi:hypothetical protein
MAMAEPFQGLCVTDAREMASGYRPPNRCRAFSRTLFIFALSYVSAACHGKDSASIRDASTERPDRVLRVPVYLDGSSEASVERSDEVWADGVYPDENRLCPNTSELLIEAPAEPTVDIAFPVLVRSRDGSPLNKSITLFVDHQPRVALTLYRGRGSATIAINRPGRAVLEAIADGYQGCKNLAITPHSPRYVSGELDQNAVYWSADSDIVITGATTIPADVSVIVQAGARVLLAPNVNLEVKGSLVVQGTEERPVLFAPLHSQPWGGIRFIAGAHGEIHHALFTGGGGDTSHPFGHSASQPVLYTENSELVVNGGGVIDNPGKAFGSQDARVSLDGLVISRCDTGGEHVRSEVVLEHSHVLEIPDSDGKIDDDDNDGIYLSGVREVNGEIGISKICDNVFAIGEDDAIDHNGAQVEVERNWIEQFVHEGVAASNQNRIVIRDTVIRGCGQAIEAGYGAPDVVVENCILMENGVGLRFGDSYDWEANGMLTVTRTVVANSSQHNVWNYSNYLSGPKPGGIEIACSIVDSVDWNGRNYNIAGIPNWDNNGCVVFGDLRLDAECGEVPIGPRTCR